MLFIEWQALPCFQFVFAGGFDVLVKTRDQHLAFGIFQLADDFDQRKQRIGRGPSVHARVQVGLCAHRFDFRIHQPSQADAQSRKVGSKQLSVANQREVRFQFRLLLADVLGDRLAAHLFFSFEDDLHVDGKFAAMRLHQ